MSYIYLFVDMNSLDRRLTGIFRASLPNDESLSRILSPATLAAEAAGKDSKLFDHFEQFEPSRGKTNNVVSEQVRHKPACTGTEDS